MLGDKGGPAVPSKKLILHSAIGILAFFIAAICLLIGYASQSTLPNGMSINGRKAGAWTPAELRQQLEQAEAGLSAWRVEWVSPQAGLPSGSGTLAAFGLRTNGEEIASLAERIEQGTLWERAKHRWTMRNQTLAWGVYFDRGQLEETVSSTWKETEAQKPSDAQRVITPGDRVDYIPGEPVLKVDRGKIAMTLVERLKPDLWVESGGAGTEALALELPLKEDYSPVTVESLKAEGIARKIIEFTTVFPGSGEGRIHNIRSTADTVHDLILKPDEVFDYQKIIQETAKRAGYRNAPVIFNGSIVPGIGGGICQVSSTLYNAVLRSGLEIVERRNHSLPVKYVPLGQDATYSGGYINFKFRNTTGNHLLIRTLTTNSAITVKLFGDIPKDISYDIESKVVKTISPPIKYIHQGTIAPGTSRVVKQGKPGYVVETHRYTKQQGVVIDKELISRDTYRATESVVAIPHGSPIPKRREAPRQAPLLEDGVSGPIYP
jgi:vancomycin resistance protein YoaR